jgi:hypothetical protein
VALRATPFAFVGTTMTAKRWPDRARAARSVPHSGGGDKFPTVRKCSGRSALTTGAGDVLTMRPMTGSLSYRKGVIGGPRTAPFFAPVISSRSDVHVTRFVRAVRFMNLIAAFAEIFRHIHANEHSVFDD